MSSTSIAKSRIEVVYPAPPSFLGERKSPDTPVSKVDHLKPVGRIYPDGEAYADELVIDEVDTIRSLGFSVSTLIYHATSSIALPAIAQHEAILSSKQLIEIEEPILTGEITTEQGWLHRHIKGLPDVYASNSPINTQYAQVTGEHHPVIFGIDPSKLERRPGTDTGDGMRLGARVALGCIAAQVVPFDKIREMKEWSAEHCPEGAITMSLDAAFMLAYGLGHRS